MTSRRQANSWFLLWAGATLALALAQEWYPATVELVRRGKTIVAQQQTPESFFAAEFGDIVVGQIEAIEQGIVRLKGKEAYWTNAETRIQRQHQPARLEEFKTGEWVELVFNSDRKNDAGQSFVMRLVPLSKNAEQAVEKRTKYNYAVMSDAKRVKVSFGEDATAFGNLVLVDQGLEELILLSDGVARLVGEGETEKLEVTPKVTPNSVEVRQGRSKAFGSELLYNNETGEASVLGPIRLERSGDKPLSGSANALTYNVDDETLLLFGQVRLVQKDRTTTAQSAVVREKDGVAFLYGTAQAPVSSESKDGKVRGLRLKYNLDTGDVLLLEGIEGEFQD
jgi:hypothetical protein